MAHTAPQVVRLPGGQLIAWYEAGPDTGAPVILLHGGGTDSALLSWQPTLAVLADAGYHAYAPDWPGYGQSPPPDGQSFSLEMLVALLPELLDAWGVARATLVGISMGGGAALGCALAAPERVERLALVGSYGLQDRVPGHRLSAIYVRLPLVNALTWWTMRASRAVLRATLRSILPTPGALTEELVDEVAAAVRHPHAMRMFAEFQRDEVRWGGIKTCYMPRLGEIQARTLIIHGSRDIGVPVADAQEAARRLPRAELHVLEGAGHWTQRDRPTEFHHRLLAFLQTGA